MKEFTFLMPCLNEAGSLSFCIEQARDSIKRLDLSAEILIADNGSGDGSVEIARKEGVRVISVASRGYGHAVIGGIHAAEGKYIIMGDADGSYDFSAVEGFADALRSGCELVMGNRFLGGIDPGAMPVSHWIGVKILSALARKRFGVNVGDYHCGIRAFDREKALTLHFRCGGMDFATEMIALFGENGARITEIPVRLARDKRSGRSHLRIVRDGWAHLWYILSKKHCKVL